MVIDLAMRVVNAVFAAFFVAEVALVVNAVVAKRRFCVRTSRADLRVAMDVDILCFDVGVARASHGAYTDAVAILDDTSQVTAREGHVPEIGVESQVR